MDNENREGINKRNLTMKNQGYIDSEKHLDCIQFLLLNPRGFRLDNIEKIEMMLEATKRYEIDGVLLSSPDRRWSSNKIKQVKRKFKRINKEIIILTLDSGQEIRTVNGYLPRGTMNILLGRVASLYVQNYNKTDKKGR